MSRLLDPEPPIQVQGNIKQGITHITWGRTEPVQEIVNRWRVDDDWWRVPISRTYLWVRTPRALLEIFHDDITGQWFLQRIID
jgi:hypothetical protein